MSGCFRTFLLLQRVPRHSAPVWRVASHPPGLRRPARPDLCLHNSPRRLIYLSPAQTGPNPLTSLLSDDRPGWSFPPHRNLSTSQSLAKQESTFARLKQMIKDYWYVIIPVEIVTSIGWYGAIFLSLRSGVDIVDILSHIGVSQETLE